MIACALLRSCCRRAFAQRADDQRPASFVDAATVVPGLIVEMRYAGSHNFVGAPIDGYDKPVCLSDPAGGRGAGAGRARSRAARAGAEGVRLLSAGAGGGAFRALGAQPRRRRRRKAEFYPQVDKRNLFRDGYIAARSGHSRGSTVDLTLARRADGKELDMGTPFDFFSPRSWPSDRQRERGGAGQSRPAGAGDAAARLRPLRQGMVALHACATSRIRDTYFDFPVR